VLIELTAEGARAAARVGQALAGLEQHALAGLPAEAVTGTRMVLRALAEGAS
jgi:DNA-binding MarR family transcriptional regulator